MRIPEEKIEDIRNSADIVDIISTYVQLKKRGKNFVGLCPFHQEKTPSFTVSEEKQIFHCFGCATGGNVFKFLMEYKSISFVEAVQEIAEELGITLDYEENINFEKQTEQEILYDINVQAARYFSDNLLKNKYGEIAVKYLKDRKVKTQTQRAFGIGYALPAWDDFIEYAEKNKISLEKANLLGLVDKKDEGGYYDKFRNRIIFPIFSPNGRVIGFGGRTLEDRTDIAKYLNSPESPIYLKRRSLYGLFQSKEEIRRLDKAILVEGYMDLIALYQNGVKNVVASSGTSLTEEQVQLLSRFTKNIIVLFDSDTAGQKASLRSIEILLKQDFDVKVISLPAGEDPDSFINNYGTEEFEEQILKAKNFLEYQISQFEEQGLLEDPAKQTEAIRELVKSAALVTDELKRNLLLKSISRKFNLREKLIESELNKFLFQSRDKQERIERNLQKLPQKGKNISEGKTASTGRVNPLEEELIWLLFKGNEQIIENIFDHIMPEDIENLKLRHLAEIVYESYKKNVVSPAALIDKIENEGARNYIITSTLNEEPISNKKWEDITDERKVNEGLIRHANDLIKKIQLNKINAQIRENNRMIEIEEDESKKMELLKTAKELQGEKKLILQNGNNLIIN
jgi:DNA primase